MKSTIEQVKQGLRIEEVVGETYTVTGRGRVLSTVEHDSLKLWVEQGTWYWFSREVGGDVLDWWQMVHGCDLATALGDLAQRAGVALRPLTQEETAQRAAERAEQSALTVAAGWFQAQLAAAGGAAARAWCQGRGWSEALMVSQGLGYAPGDQELILDAMQGIGQSGGSLVQGLQAAGVAQTQTAQQVLSLPGGMIVYVHRERGRVVYLSARSIVGKRHWNLSHWEAAVAKQVYRNQVAGDGVLIVEGQADAVSLAGLGVAAVALCGLAADVSDVTGVTAVGLDNDERGRAKALTTALQFGPLVRVVTWPTQAGPEGAGAQELGKPVKDAGDLALAGVSGETVRGWIDAAPTALAVLADRAGRAKGEQKSALITEFFRQYGVAEGQDQVRVTYMQPALQAALGVSKRQWNELRKTATASGEGEHESPERYAYSPGGYRGGQLWEQCVQRKEDGSAWAFFLVRGADGRIEERRSVDVGGVTYLPVPASESVIERGVVLFPSRHQGYGGEERLLADVRAFIHQWLDIDPFYEQLATYYVLFTWLYDLFQTIPYLRALGDYGTGKTRFIETIGALCYRPMFLSGASSSAAVFRVIGMMNGTLVVDEADFGQSDTYADIIKIINVGNSKTGVVLKAEKNGSSDAYGVVAYPVFGPKILATRNLFEDRATESRCLTKQMSTKRPRPDIKRMVDDGFWQEAEGLRNRLLNYRLTHYRPMTVDHSLSDQTLEPRLDQVTLALKTIIQSDETREQLGRFIRLYNDRLISDRQLTLPSIVVEVLAQIHFSPEQTTIGPVRDYSIKAISDRAREMLVEFDPEESVTPRKVGGILSDQLGLVQRGRDAGGRRTLAFEEEQLESLMVRYGIERPGPTPTQAKPGAD